MDLDLTFSIVSLYPINSDILLSYFIIATQNKSLLTNL